MLPREIVLAALNHEETERVPIAIGGSASKFYTSTTLELMKHYGIPEERIQYAAAGFKYITFSDELWEKMGIDVRYIYPDTHGEKLLEAQKNHGVFINKWGSKFTFRDDDGEHLNIEEDVVLPDATIEDLDKYKWPKPGPEILKGLKERAEKLKNDNRYAIGMYRPLEVGVFNTARYFLRGSVKFFEDMLLNKDFAIELLKRIRKVQEDYYIYLLKEVGEMVDIVDIEEDLGMQDRPMISPQLYRELIKPEHEKLISTIKKHAPQAKVLLHCDGSVKELIADFIDAGVDILNPIQVNAKGMELKTLKKEFGKNIIFAGAVDVQKPMMGSIEDVERCVKETIDIMAPGGGYLLGPSHNFSSNISYINIIAMVETARNYRFRK
jgi:uroporphyrinogen decarboxylase